MMQWRTEKSLSCKTRLSQKVKRVHAMPKNLLKKIVSMYRYMIL